MSYDPDEKCTNVTMCMASLVIMTECILRTYP